MVVLAKIQGNAFGMNEILECRVLVDDIIETFSRVLNQR